MRIFCAFVVIFVAGCQSVREQQSDMRAQSSLVAEIRELEAADISAVVDARTRQNDWRFLACYSDDPEGLFFPGLTAEEIKTYLDSDRYGYEVYHDHRIVYVVEFNAETKEWEAARWHYAERMNRTLLKTIRATEGAQPGATDNPDDAQ